MAPELTPFVVVQYWAYDLDPETRDLLASFAPSLQLKGVAKLKAVDGYMPVAVMKIAPGMTKPQSLEMAYRVMQNGIESESWTLDPPKGLTPLVAPIETSGRKYGHRSATLGDLLEIGGNQFVVSAVGFTKIE